MPTKKQNEHTKQKDIVQILSFATDYLPYFKKIDIEKLRYKDINATIRYKNGVYLDINANNFKLKGKIKNKNSSVKLIIDSLNYATLQTYAKGDVLFEKSKKRLVVNLDIKAFKQAYFLLHGELKGGIFSFTTRFKKPIKDTASILSKLHLPKEVRYWTITAIDAKSIKIKKCQGRIDLNNPKTALKTIEIKAVADALKYTYNPKLEPILTKYTLLEFTKGVLYIKPNHPQTYGYDLEKSYLTIDFARQNELLTLYLRFKNGFLDKNIIHLLSVYNIDIPLLQLTGKTRTDLTIAVTLRKIGVDAKGTFKVKQGRFRYLGMDIDVKNLMVDLHNSHVVVKKMDASIDTLAAVKVDIDLELAKRKGRIDFYTQKIELKKYNLALKTKPHIVYVVNKKGNDFIEVPKTLWRFGDMPINVDKTKIAFFFDKKKLSFPTVTFTIPKKAIALVSGEVFFGEKKANLDIDLIKLHYSDLKLAQSDMYVHLLFEKGRFDLFSTKQSRLTIGGKEASIDKFHIYLQDSKLNAKDVTITYNNLFSGNLDLNYDFDVKKGSLKLKKSKFSLSKETSLFENDKPIVLQFHSTKNGMQLSSKELTFLFDIENKKEHLKILSIKKFLPYSKFLQRFKIESGKISLQHKRSDKKLRLKGVLYSDYALFYTGDESKHKYIIQGTIENEKSSFTLNKCVSIDIDQDIKIAASDIAIDTMELRRFVQDSKKDDSKRKLLFATLKNGFFYLNDYHRILFDKVELQSTQEEMSAQLFYGKGAGGFRYKKGYFYLYGENFDDVFMDNLFYDSKFKGGRLDFNIVGTFKSYDGIIVVSDTTVLNYKLLNNIFAFINTVPALVTFSSPHYSSEGLKVKKAYTSFHYKNDLYTLENVKLDSSQFELLGKGKLSYEKNFIDLTLLLKTRLGEKASKIPVAGYLLFDGDTLSTTLRVQGDINKPKITTTIVKDVVIAPLNIIKRTLLLPLKIFELGKMDANATTRFSKPSKHPPRSPFSPGSKRRRSQ